MNTKPATEFSFLRALRVSLVVAAIWAVCGVVLHQFIDHDPLQGLTALVKQLPILLVIGGVWEWQRHSNARNESDERSVRPNTLTR